MPCGSADVSLYESLLKKHSRIQCRRLSWQWKAVQGSMSKIVSDVWLGMVLECEWEEAGNDTETRPAVNECVKNESEGVDGCHRGKRRVVWKERESVSIVQKSGTSLEAQSWADAVQEIALRASSRLKHRQAHRVRGGDATTRCYCASKGQPYALPVLRD